MFEFTRRVVVSPVLFPDYLICPGFRYVGHDGGVCEVVRLFPVDGPRTVFYRMVSGPACGSEFTVSIYDFRVWAKCLF